MTEGERLLIDDLNEFVRQTSEDIDDLPQTTGIRPHPLIETTEETLGTKRFGFGFAPPPTAEAFPSEEPPPLPAEGTGACCASDGTCMITTEADCVASGGTYNGNDTICRTIKIVVGMSGNGTTLIDNQRCGEDGPFINYWGHEDLCFDFSGCELDTGVLDVPMFTCNLAIPPPDSGTLRFVFSLDNSGNLSTDLYITNDIFENGPSGDCCEYTFHTHRIDSCPEGGCEFVIPTGFGMGGFNFMIDVTYDDSCP